MTDTDTDGREAAIAGCRAAHARLLSDLAALTDDEAGQPSSLPDWTVGHVVTHIARNADSFTGILAAAQRGEIADQYPGGIEQRTTDIEAGAGRPASELLADVTEACRRLEAQWDAMTDTGWKGQGRTMAGMVTAGELPWRRWREVEIHHADLGLAFTWRNWSEPFVTDQLPRELEELPERLPPGARAAVLAWLVGRAPQPDVDPGPWQRERRP